MQKFTVKEILTIKRGSILLREKPHWGSRSRHTDELRTWAHASTALKRYFQGIRKIVLTEAVKIIDDASFCKLKDLQEIELNNSLQWISKEAFAECTALEQIKLPPSIQSIEEGVFRGCTQLKTVEPATELKTIRKEAFKGCKQLVVYYTQKTTGGYYGRHLFRRRCGKSNVSDTHRIGFRDKENQTLYRF